MASRGHFAVPQTWTTSPSLESTTNPRVCFIRWERASNLMSSNTGRPRMACSTCKIQKIRCTGEQPRCKRCVRLRHTCTYIKGKIPKASRGSNAVNVGANSSSQVETSQEEANVAGNRVMKGIHSLLADHNTVIGLQKENFYLGISEPLLLTLVDVYFENVYQSDLLLHKRMFLKSLAEGTAREHIVLSVCAFAANFYRDKNDEAILKDHGFMNTWAKRAGKLVFLEAEDLNEENIITFCNLSLFWHGQGAWRLSHLHKGNACQFVSITGLGSEACQQGDPLESELRRRRVWACYLLQCHSSEALSHFQSSSDMRKFPLPCPEYEFSSGSLITPGGCLSSDRSNGGLFAEVLKALTLWSSVASLTKGNESVVSNEKIRAIHELEEKMSNWWHGVEMDLKLTSSNMANVPHDALPKVLLINIVYHQCLCTLHASVVPLFCLTQGDRSHSPQIQLSAQIAYEHACLASELIATALATSSRPSAMPSFVAYAAYCACAIQIPFMSCLNVVVKECAAANFAANVRMIEIMANFWKFPALLRV
ncbi:hypothetical protein ACMFMG_004075 [Clarireedia jacksonii]